MYNNSLPRLGLCCLLVGNHKTQFKTVRLGWMREHSSETISKLHSIWSHNLQELIRVLDYCKRHDIWGYRLSSDLFPLADLEEYRDIWKDFCMQQIYWTATKQHVADYINLGGRLSTHPGQFCVISNTNPDITHRSILNLEHHAEFFDALNIPASYFFPINIHISNGKKEQAAAHAVLDNLETLSDSLRKRLVFENEDKSFWTWQKIRKYFPDVPVTLDYHHRLINNLGETEQLSHEQCVESWQQHNIKPLFHYTEGRAHELDRSHADFITKLPAYTNADLEIEAKQKNHAILKCMSWTAGV